MTSCKGLQKIFAILVVLAATQVQAYIAPNQYYDPVRKLNMGVAATGWDFFSADDVTSHTTDTDLKLQFVARSPQVLEGGVQPTLTLRIDQGDWRTARAYAERWLRDFPKFGYELQSSKETKYGDLTGYDMELVSKNSNRSARQFVVRQPHEMWVFTCSGDSKHFPQAWKACERILTTAQVR